MPLRICERIITPSYSYLNIFFKQNCRGTVLILSGESGTVRPFSHVYIQERSMLSALNNTQN